ncbi:MAG: hypothetical protein HYY84_05040 [Deltaproteobacteria bacterium]|nr:hypothetical protein [Deltaproteobacteria bacterium]
MTTLTVTAFMVAASANPEKCLVNPNEAGLLELLMAGYELPQAAALAHARHAAKASAIKDATGIKGKVAAREAALNCGGLCAVGHGRADRWKVLVFDKKGTCDPKRQAPKLFSEAFSAWKNEVCRQRRLCRCETKKECEKLPNIPCADENCPPVTPPPPLGRASWAVAYGSLKSAWGEMMAVPALGKCFRGLAEWYLKPAPKPPILGCDVGTK